MRPLNTSRYSFLTLLHASHSSHIYFAYPCFLLSSRLPSLPLISSFNRAPRVISHATTRSLARSRLRHARLAVAVAVVARPRPPVHDVYDLWLLHSGESGCFCARMRIYHDNRTPPDWVPLCGITAARILRAFNA